MGQLLIILIDILLSTSFIAIVFLHLIIAPYTKIEESFNIEATHDILTYGIPSRNITATLAAHYDHVTYPGPVPRTFLGPLLLAAISKPILTVVGSEHAQFVVRAVLGLFNSFAILNFQKHLADGFGKGVARWYLVLQASQFHLMFYSSRTLPGSFAIGLGQFFFKRLCA